jgi:hypothetical protein
MKMRKPLKPEEILVNPAESLFQKNSSDSNVALVNLRGASKQLVFHRNINSKRPPKTLSELQTPTKAPFSLHKSEKLFPFLHLSSEL